MNLIKKNYIEWETFAQIDPYWSILTDSKLKFGKWNIESFFDTGSKDISSLIDNLQKNSIGYKKEKALDFGCGVGRLTQALGMIFKEVHGVDISETMIKRAEELNKSRNCIFHYNQRENLLIFRNDSFDFIYSCITLQHIPSNFLILNYVKEFLRILRKDGLIIFQLPDRIPHQWAQKIYFNFFYVFLSKIFSSNFLHKHNLIKMRMNYIKEEVLIKKITEFGGKIILTEEDYSAGPKIISKKYYITK